MDFIEFIKKNKIIIIVIILLIVIITVTAIELNKHNKSICPDKYCRTNLLDPKNKGIYPFYTKSGCTALCNFNVPFSDISLNYIDWKIEKAAYDKLYPQ